MSYLFFTSVRRPCYCESTWNDIVCKNMKKYMEMDKNTSPSLCICQKYSIIDNKCLQFMMRCVAKNNNNNFSKRNDFKDSYMVNKYKYKITLDKKRDNLCSCCFNQPDEYCNHFSCHEMVPFFDKEKETSCNCFSTINFPYFICNNTGNTNDERIEKIINSLNIQNHDFVKKNRQNVDDSDEKKYKQISSELKINKKKSPLRMNFLTNGVVLNVFGCIVLVFIIGTIICFIKNNSKSSSQRSRNQIIDPNTEFLMDQRTSV